MENDQQNPGENPTSIPLFSPPAGKNNPKCNLGSSNQPSPESLKGNLVQLLFIFFISKCLWISETLQEPAPGQGQQRQCRSSALPGPTGSPFPGAGGEDSLMFTEKRKSFFSSQQEVGWGQEALFGTGHTTASPESKVFPQLRRDQENKQTATCKTCS